MKFPKVLTPGSESGGFDEDVRETVDGSDKAVEESWEDARRLNTSRMDCNLREGFVDMVEEQMAPCEAVYVVVDADTGYHT